MEKIIIGNWKMNPDSKLKAFNIFSKIANNARKNKKENKKFPKIIIAPPFIYISELIGIVKREKINFIDFASQDVFWENKGSYTGEISPKMLKSLGVKYAIIGHSERREIIGEDDVAINKKAKLALENNLNIILCIGEKRTERRKDKAKEVLGAQISKGLRGISFKKAKNIIIAYEPIWAIGAKEACSLDLAEEAILYIKSRLRKIFSQNGEKIKVIYGGSINKDNAKNYLNSNIIGGLLIGRASLKPSDFNEIIFPK